MTSDELKSVGREFVLQVLGRVPDDAGHVKRRFRERLLTELKIVVAIADEVGVDLDHPAEEWNPELLGTMREAVDTVVDDLQALVNEDAVVEEVRAVRRKLTELRAQRDAK
jgi:hypothetical protein